MTSAQSYVGKGSRALLAANMPIRNWEEADNNSDEHMTRRD